MIPNIVDTIYYIWWYRDNKADQYAIIHQTDLRGKYRVNQLCISFQLKCRANVAYSSKVSAEEHSAYRLDTAAMPAGLTAMQDHVDKTYTWENIDTTRRRRHNCLSAVLITDTGDSSRYRFTYCPLGSRRWPEVYLYFRLRNDLYCVGWGVKLYSLTPEMVIESKPVMTIGNTIVYSVERRLRQKVVYAMHDRIYGSL